jgi:hypothetical protein
MKPTATKATLLVALAGLAACAAEPVYQQPYAIFTTEQVAIHSGSSPTYRIKVDGATLEPRDSIPVMLGPRKVELTPVDSGGAGPTPTAFNVDAQACTRYVLVATRAAATSDEWKLAVNKTEPIGECTRKFGAKY